MYISKSELELLLSLLGVRINLLVYCIRYVCVCVCVGASVSVLW